MKFILDTENMEEMQLIFSEQNKKGDINELIIDFCDGMTFFFLEFAAKRGCNTEMARALKKACIGTIDKYIEENLEKGVFEPDDTDLNEEDIDNLRNRMIEAGLSEETISYYIDVVRKMGSVESANNLLKTIINDLEK